jgi:hypothetical protein
VKSDIDLHARRAAISAATTPIIEFGPRAKLPPRSHHPTRRDRASAGSEVVDSPIARSTTEQRAAAALASRAVRRLVLVATIAVDEPGVAYARGGDVRRALSSDPRPVDLDLRHP